MLVGAVISILLPLSRRANGQDEKANALDVYRQQLNENDKKTPNSDEEKELLEIERAEIARRILRENRRSKSTITAVTKRGFGVIVTSLMALVLLPMVTLAFYYQIGAPGTPDYPLSAKRLEKLENKSIEEMVRIAERHLAKNPNDAKGWTVLANVYGRLNRPADRAHAFEQIIRISGSTSDRLAELGEALTVADGNVVSDRARKLFETAWKQDKRNLKASVYLALALEQEGRFDMALTRWMDLSKSRKDDTEWQAMTSERLALLKQRMSGNAFKGPSAEDVKDAAELDENDRTAMIEGMVKRLAGKLEDDPSDFQGWSRLIRSYAILKRREDAAVAFQKAKLLFRDNPERIDSLNKLATQLNISNISKGITN